MPNCSVCGEKFEDDIRFLKEIQTWPNLTEIVEDIRFFLKPKLGFSL
jgi:hypothetical protein